MRLAMCVDGWNMLWSTKRAKIRYPQVEICKITFRAVCACHRKHIPPYACPSCVTGRRRAPGRVTWHG